MAVHARGALPFARDRSRAEPITRYLRRCNGRVPTANRGTAPGWKRKRPGDEPLACLATRAADRRLRAQGEVLVSASLFSMSGSPGRGRDSRLPDCDSGPESHRQARNGPRGVGDTSPDPAIETASTSL